MKERLKKIIREYWNIRVEILLTAAFVCVFFALNGGQIAQEVFAPASGDRAEAVEAAGAGQTGDAADEDGSAGEKDSADGQDGGAGKNSADAKDGTSASDNADSDDGAEKKDSTDAKDGTSASDNADSDDGGATKKNSADGQDGGAGKNSADAKDGMSATDNADSENDGVSKKDSADAKDGTSATDNADDENGGAAKKDSADAKDGTSASDDAEDEDSGNPEEDDAGSTESGSPDDARDSTEITASGEIRVSDVRNGYELVVYRPAPFAQETQEIETLRELVDTREMRGYRRLLSQEQMARLGIREQEVAERMGLTEQELVEYQTKEIYPVGRSFSLLEEMLSNRISGYDGDWSVYVKNLETEESLVFNDVPMKSASVMKLFIMGTVYKAFESGELERTEEVMSLMNNMITVSDNEASNRLLQLLGDGSYADGIAKVDEFIQEYGFSDMTVEYNGFNNSDTVIDSGHSNQVSAKDCGKLLEDIYRRSWANRSVSNEMEEMLLNQQTRYKIPAGLPEGVLCGNKTGEMDTTENDAAIVYAENCDYILVVLSSDWNSKDEAVSRIKSLSGMVYEYLN